MKTKLVNLGSVFLFVNWIHFASSSVSEAATLMTLKDFLKKELAGAPKISKETFSLNEEQKKTLHSLAPDSQDGEFTFYYAKSNEGKLQIACSTVSQQGKEGPLSIGICFEPQGLVKSVVILESEEDHGRKIAEAAWLKQFSGKKVSDAFQVGQDVNGISGATRSSKAVSEALRKTSYAFKTFVGEKK